jgi:hypothetical protein
MNMKKYIIIFVASILLFSCAKKEEKGIALAQVDKEVLYLEDFKSTFSLEDWDNLSPEQRKKYIEDWVNLTLLSQYADSKGLDKDKAVKQKISYATKKVKANALIAKRLSQIEVSEDQLFNYFRLHQGEFKKNAVEYEPAAELSYIKCDIDYSALIQNETISNETVYSGPSTVEIKDIASNVSNSSQTTEPPAQEASSAPGFSGILAGLSLVLIARRLSRQ